MWALRVGTIVLATASVASAQPGLEPPRTPDPARPAEHAYVGIGLLFAASHLWLMAGGLLEGGARIPLPATFPIALRVRAFTSLGGDNAESDWVGEFKRYGAGVEARSCTQSNAVCGFAGLDAGYQRLTIYDDSNRLAGERSGPLIGPRIGLDAGGRLRVRFVLDLYKHKVSHDPALWYGNGGLVLSITYQR